MRKLVIIFGIILTGVVSNAQQDAQYTQYMYNTINVNPGYAGSRGVMSVFGLYRTQWVGLDGAPDTGAFSINTPIANSNLGFGLSVVDDRIGPITEDAISADVSYTVPMSDTYKLSFGVKGTANLFNLDRDKLHPESDQTGQTDNLLNGYKSFSPNVGAGVYLHSNKFYLGLSVPNILQTKRFSKENKDISIFVERMNGYLIGGYVFDIGSNLKFKPAFLAKAVQGAPLQLDLTGNFLINEKFILGAAWRWDAAVSLLAGFQVNKSLLIGYGYDKETTKLAGFNSGSHEIFLRYELFKKPERIVSPRFF
jgi:type IX secretion system PorP/SprF family membrane protein